MCLHYLKILKSKVVLKVTAVAWKSSRLWVLKQVIFRFGTALISHCATWRFPGKIKRITYWCAVLWGCYWKKVHETSLKMFLSLLKRGSLYSFLLISFFVNFSTPSLFYDDWTSMIFWQETFLNCLVCLSSRADWSQTLWRTLFPSCLRSLAERNKQMICFLIWN